jgi:hypothetical protein
MEPFTTIHIDLNGNRFELSDRMFFSIPGAWEGATTRHGDFRELIPEFFTTPDFLLNENDFDLGTTADGPVGDVVLPPWSGGSAHRFIDLHRQALESPIVTSHLPEWIDLIFGFANFGPAAVKANNTFHAFTHASSVTRDVLKDPVRLQVVQGHAAQLGVIPRQLFSAPHVKRIVLPIVPNFSNASLSLLFRLPVPPRHFHVHGSVLYVVRADSTLVSVALRRSDFDFQTLGSIAPFMAVPEDGAVSPKRFAYLIGSGRFVASSLWDGAFHVFRIDQTSLAHSHSVRQRFALLATLSPAGGALLLAGWRDSSLALWNVAEPRAPPLYRKTRHLAAVVDVVASADLRIVASLDQGRECVLSLIDSGEFVREFAVEGNDTLLRVMLFGAGFMAVLAEAADGATVIVRLYGLNGRMIGRTEVAGGVVEWCGAEVESGPCAVAVALKSGVVTLLGVPDLRTVGEVSCSEKVVVLTFAVQMNGFVIGTADGEVHFLKLG